MKCKHIYFLLLFFLCYSSIVFSQEGKKQINNFDTNQVKTQLESTPKWETHVSKNNKPIVSLPSADGTFHRFRVEEFSVFEPEMAARYPQINSYVGQGVDDPTKMIRFNISPLGYYGVCRDSNGIGIVEREDRTNPSSAYIAYYEDAGDFECSVDENIDRLGGLGNSYRVNSCFQNGDVLRTFRMAVTVTHEYTTLYGGTLASVNAAIANRLAGINAVYENEVAVHFVLPANNDLLVNDVLGATAGTDPFTDLTDRNITMNEGATHISTLLAAGDYDLGHTFHEVVCPPSCSVGGVAGLGVVCREDGTPPQKAKGYSPLIQGSSLILMLHEVGHQFSCHHTNYGCGTNNKCSRYEPGQGSTIMSTSPGCVAGDFYEGRSDYFNVESIRSILDFMNNGDVIFTNATCTPNTVSAGMCAATTSSGNTPPTANANPNGGTYTIPPLTPFLLEGEATDPNGDALTYTWEQYDTDYAGSIVPDDAGSMGTTTDPLFRSFPPSTNPDRMCPQISSLLAGNVTAGTGEALPNEARIMTWRLIVRDNYAGAGGISCDEIAITVDATASPFAVTTQNTPETWNADGTATTTVTWNVSGTTAAPISCANVDILFSQDGGQTYPFTLASGVPNDGSETFIIPSYPTTQGRVQVVCSDNIFFDINDADITITSSCAADAASITPTTAVEADPGDAALNLSLMPTYGTAITNFTGDIQNTDLASNLAYASDNTFASCSGPSNPNFYDVYTFYVDAADTYNFTFPVGDFPLVVNLYQGSFNPASVCSNWLISDSFFDSGTGNIDPSGNPFSIALTPGIPYVLTVSSFSTSFGVGDSYDVAVSGSGGGQAYDNIPPPTPLPDYNYAYVVVNDATGIIELVSATGPNLTSLCSGDYSVHGLSYEIASLADPTTYQTMLFTTLQNDMAALIICGDLSTNVVDIRALSTVTFTALPDLCPDAGVQAGLGGGSPTGGVYSGSGVTDDGNGVTYTFDPSAAGVGIHTLTYTVGGSGCTDSAMDNVEVFALPTVTLTALADICIDAGVQAGLGSGTPTGGVYSGTGVTDDGNGMTYSFDPAAAGVGTHTLSYTFTDGNGCSNSGSDAVEVFALPTVTLTALADICIDAGVQAGLGSGTPTGGVYSGTGVTDDGNGMTYSFDPAAAGVGTHTLSYTFTDGNGCSNSGSDAVEVFALPTVTLTALADLCIDAGVQAGLGGGSPTGGIYTGAGITDDGNGMTYSFDPATAGVGTHTLSYTFTDANGCTNSATDAVEVFALPTVTFTALADICIDAGVQAGLGSGTPTGGVYSGTGVTDDGNGMTYSFDPAAAGVGTHTLSYTFTDGNGCSNSGSDAVEVFALPTVTLTALADICIDTGVQAGLGSGTPTGGVYSGTGVTDDGNGMTYSFDPAGAGVGTHTLSYTFTDGNGCSSSGSDAVEVFALPTVTFTGLADICIDAGVQAGLGGGSPTGGIYTGAGITDDGNGMTYSFDPATAGVGIHTLTYTFTDANGCTNSDTDAVEVFALPTVTFTGLADICIDAGVQAGLGSGTPTGGVYSGTGVTDDGNGMTYSFDPAAGGGVHTISYNYADTNGCSGSATDDVEVINDITPPTPPMPPADVNVQCSANLPPPVDLTATDNFDGDITVSPSAVITPGNCDNQFAMVRTWTFIDNCGNQSSVSQTINANDTTAPNSPAAPADVNIQCPADIPPPVDLTANDNCDGTITVSPSAVITPGNCDNQFTMVRTWTFMDNCGNQSSVSQTINVNDTTAPNASCQNITVQLDVNNMAMVTANDIDNNSSDNCGNVSLAISNGQTNFTCADAGQTFMLTLTATDDCGNMNSCVSQVTIADDTNPCCDISITNVVTADESCPASDNGTITINAVCNSCANGMSDILYSIGGALQSSPVFTGVGAGTYNVSVYDVNDLSCLDNLMSGAIVNEPTVLTVSAAADMEVECNGDFSGQASSTVSGGTPPYSYAWSNGDNTASIANIGAGGYTVTVTDTNGCTATASINITQPSAMNFVTNLTNIYTCEGSATLQVLVNNGTPPYQYEWMYEDGSPIPGGFSMPSYTFNPTMSDNDKVYQVRITDANGCALMSNQVCIYTTVVDAGVDRTTCAGESVQLGGGTNASVVEWMPADGLSCTDCPYPIATPMTTTTYSMVAKQTITYREYFTQGVEPTAQVERWCKFRNQLDPSLNYTSLTIRGSQDSEGITITNPTQIAGIANALRTGIPYYTLISGNTWKVDVGCSNILSQCNPTGGISLNVNGNGCFCANGTDNFTIRPEIGNENWGGIGGIDCNAVSQEMEVFFEYTSPTCTDEVTVTVDNCEPECPANYSLGGVELGTTDYETDGIIQSNQTIANSSLVDYDAGECIELNPGFEVQLGAEFDAFIDGCNDGAGGNQ